MHSGSACSLCCLPFATVHGLICQNGGTREEKGGEVNTATDRTSLKSLPKTASIIEDEYPYGLRPAQVYGLLPDDRPFHYYCQDGKWRLNVGQRGWPVDSEDWPSDQLSIYWEGDGNFIAKLDVDTILNKLIPGWQSVDIDTIRRVKQARERTTTMPQAVIREEYDGDLSCEDEVTEGEALRELASYLAEGYRVTAHVSGDEYHVIVRGTPRDWAVTFRFDERTEGRTE